MNEILEKIVAEANLNMIELKTKKTIAVVINIFMGTFKDYDDYLRWCTQEQQDYVNKINQKNTFNPYTCTFIIPVEPAPVLNEEIFNYIKDFGKE